jgi:thymidylate synthase (FAD)
MMIEVTYIDHMGSDLSVVNAARVSFGKKSASLGYSRWVDENMKPIMYDKDKRLIKYLAKHKHMSPFGHAFASFHVKAPIFVARQLVKHKFLRWNEISRRYVDDDPEFYEPDVWRGRSADKKQGSEGEIQHIHIQTSQQVPMRLYESLLDKGVCPEQARMVLPQNLMTEWYWSGSLDAFMDMCNLRCKLDTQYETRLVAEYILSEMINLFPISVEALRK